MTAFGFLAGCARSSLALILSLLTVPLCPGQSPKTDLSELSLEALLNTEVSSVSRKQERSFQVAAALFVIRAEDIRRSGAASLPDLLRLVPGLEVAQISASAWAITARGFNAQFANKLLVLIDGRAVYSPLFSGIYWDVQDVPLEEIERIEVIRGPGASVWGANAVNGVINIITRAAAQSQGGLLVVGGGNHERGLATVRYGGRAGARGHYRAYGKYANRGPFELPSGGSAQDQWNLGSGGVRGDWNLSAHNSLVLDAGLYGGRASQVLTRVVSFAPPFTLTRGDRTKLTGGHMLGRWTREVPGDSRLSLQFFYDRTDRYDISNGETRHTADLDFTYQKTLARRHDVVAGLGFRRTADRTDPVFLTVFEPRRRRDRIWSGFVQDELKLFSDAVRLTFGSKFEHNDFSGFEVQPSVRAAWTLHRRHVLWGAVSRAVRTPSRVDQDLRFVPSIFPVPGGPPTGLRVVGDRAFRPETLLAYELGYRLQAGQTLSLDLAAFFNLYRHLQASRSGVAFLETNPAPLHVIVPLELFNGARGHTYGLEVASTLNLSHRWRLHSGLTLLRQQLRLEPGVVLSLSLSNPGNDPAWQAHLRSHLDLPRQFAWDVSLQLVGPLPGQTTGSYQRLGTRLGWLPNEHLELSVVLQNLVESGHLEFLSGVQSVRSSLVPRTAYARIAWRF